MLCLRYYLTRTKVRVHRVDLKITHGMSSTNSSSVTKIQFPDGSEVRDLKFADDRNLILILGKEGSLI